ncbi:ABC transporter ATP-binding protein [Lysinibacillus capsici]|uniref:ABC transporter ATP-binding protein n=1 Tax=Lysinibacillus capsici TaxID=2115968 RepID=UPI00029CA888|nr:ABC transporter ATP-binding protein [Lysinibacillus capsici]EKU44405.1 oligopeptide transport system ATP-binding protein [Lysinibacillus fusiformis ZB2]MBU5252047.1 ABC transporter ATP-binding protein [Lysinibacillus capsici]MED4697447.1 ABC transporter ATP-binding protein [Lysinibacillus capsici]
MSLNILEVSDLKIGIQQNKKDIAIVNGVSFQLEKGKTLGIVGESGCGKSMTSLSLMGLLPAGVNWQGGEVYIDQKQINKKSKKEWRKIRGKKVSMIFQEPMSSLNPVYKVGSQIMEMIHSHEKISRKEAHERAIDMLRLVGIPRPDKVVNEYPHQLSGGMRQRVMIAMALACGPEILIADEPTTALDVTIQAQILDLMKDIQEKLDMSIILITHDLGVVAEICERVIVMYAGEIVEEATVLDLFNQPLHPYTKGLLNSLPDIESEQEYLPSIEGVVPSPSDMPSGCRFFDRCEFATDQCKKKPDLFTTSNDTKVRCWLYEENEVGGGIVNGQSIVRS